MIKDVKFIAILVIGVITVISMGVVAWQIHSLRQIAALSEIRSGKIEDTSAILNHGNQSSVSRKISQSIADQSRSNYHQELSNAIQANPALADRYGQHVPIELRNLAHSRRIARERLGCDDGNCDR